MKDYTFTEAYDGGVRDETRNILRKTQTWLNTLEGEYIEREIQTGNQTNTNENVSMFKGEGEMHIYEFFNKFERKFHKISKVNKAEELYESYLADAIKNQVLLDKANYDSMKQSLIQHFGGVHNIIETAMRAREKEIIPDMNNIPATCERLTKILTTIRRFKDLKGHKEVDLVVWESAMYAPKMITRLKGMLPMKMEKKLNGTFSKKGWNIMNNQGKAAIEEFKSFCEYQLTKEGSVIHREDTARPRKPTQAKQLLQNVQEQELQEHWEAEEDQQPTVHTTVTTGWFNPQLKKPCPFRGHDHEIGTCSHFFGLRTFKRREAALRKLCWTCLDPKERCMKKSEGSAKPFKCVEEKNLNQSLICRECHDYVQRSGKEYSPVSIVFCNVSQHKKPEFGKIAQLMKTWLPGFNQFEAKQDTQQKQQDKKLVQSVQMQECIHTVTRRTEGIQTVIDSSTGERVQVDAANIIPEPEEESAYMLQWLKIGDSPALVFFDTGADSHLISGSLAEKENLELISDYKPKMATAGGGETDTTGIYRLCLGPDPGGQYRELSAFGMKEVIIPFKRIDLTEVNKEIREVFGDVGPLPEFLGGDVVHLLLGIKGSAIQPVQLGTLPSSGTGVYRSPFTDMYGSNICIVGSHKLFGKRRGIKAEIEEAMQVHHIRMMERQMVLENIFPAAYPKEQPLEIENNMERIETTPIAMLRKDAFARYLCRCLNYEIR